MKKSNLIAFAKTAGFTFEQRKKTAIELTSLLLKEAQRIQTPAEKRTQQQLARMMEDPKGKAFTTAMTDQCFRTSSYPRVANQLLHIIHQFGIPRFLTADRRLELLAFKYLAPLFPQILVPLTKRMLRQETAAVILPGEEDALIKHLKKRRNEGVRINLNHLGEAILGEEEAKKRLHIYLDDLSKPEVEYISVKISTIYSQLNLLAWEDTLKILSERLKQLYRTASQNSYLRPDGTAVPKFVNLDMEEYRDLHLTVELFCRVLSEPEFTQHSAGIVLQSYLPDSFLIQQELTQWAMQRIAKGGAPIKIRIVKGANLGMEQVEASLRNWPQAPYPKKSAVDANFKKMITYGCLPEHAKAAHLGIASHNLFDIAYSLIIRSENNVEPFTCFEMLEGMADSMRRAVQELADDMLLYCPAAKKEEFQNAVAYLVRRLDENTAPENFLRCIFSLEPGKPEWYTQETLFLNACQEAFTVSNQPRRTQDRFKIPLKPPLDTPFENEPDTDWSLQKNREWANQIITQWNLDQSEIIPLVIGGKTLIGNSLEKKMDPSQPTKLLYRYSLADQTHVQQALETAKKQEEEWSQTAVAKRSALLAEIAQGLRESRGDLIGAMVADTAKTISEADVEISEAIDFAEYYRRNLEEFSTLADIQWKPKGTLLISPPWNFPCSIPAGGILAALAGGNCVLFKPAPESILVGWLLAQIFWKAGIKKEVLQFITCSDDPIGSMLIRDARINSIVLTGSTETAKLFLNMRPGLDLIAETGGKNALIITALSDRDLAIKDLLQSAFGYSGQKCSACSLAILEREVYEDPHFRQQLKDAAQSLPVGSAWDPKTRINPLIHLPNSILLRGLTSLDEGEEWLLQPKQDPHNPNLWSPGIKLGVKEGSFTHQNELFGPVLGLMCADNLKHAISLANGTPYGLTSGIHSLDDREQEEWLAQIEAGNCYINRGITGAIVQRQPFGGCKASSFGRGLKAGGSNYLTQFMIPHQVCNPLERSIPPTAVNSLYPDSEKKLQWEASIGSYAFYWNHYFSKTHDPSMLLGEDNKIRYVPQKRMILRIQKNDSPLDYFRAIAASLICQTPLEVSGEVLFENNLFNSVAETEEAFINRLAQLKTPRIRLLSKPTSTLSQALASLGCNLIQGPVVSNGRIELLNYLREVSCSYSYHRYGNLGIREGEERKPLSHYNCKNSVTVQIPLLRPGYLSEKVIRPSRPDSSLSFESGRDGLITFSLRYPDEGEISELLQNSDQKNTCEACHCHGSF